MKFGVQTSLDGLVERLKKRDLYEIDFIVGVRLRTLHEWRYGEDARWKISESLERSRNMVFGPRRRERDILSQVSSGYLVEASFLP